MWGQVKQSPATRPGPFEAVCRAGEIECGQRISGALYRPGDPELVADRAASQSLQRQYNQTIVSDVDARAPILSRWLGGGGKGTSLRAPLYVDYGYNVTLGEDVFLNYGCILLDVCPIRIGHRTQVGPRVQILTADHPRDAETRAAGLEFGRPIEIGENVWIGGGALLLPGVRIGKDAVIGAGAVVTRNVGPGETVAGNPARPL
jgi:maltose O-acetyltransferase